jgi:phosphopantetheinyl transferase
MAADSEHRPAEAATIVLCILPGEDDVLVSVWLDRLLPSVEPSEKLRILSKIREIDQLRSAVGQVMLTTVATRLLHGAAFQLRRTLKNRPFFTVTDPTAQATIDANLSHQGRYVLCAGAVNKCIGVDIMDAASLTFLVDDTGLDSLTAFLHPCELAFCRSFADHDGLLRAVSLVWVLKEAFVKVLYLIACCWAH